jgi:hypothetical protein
MRKLSLLFGALLLGGAPLQAEEHAACWDMDYRFEQHSPQELRQIAASCRSALVSTLYSQRAEHADLLQEHMTLSNMTVQSRGGKNPDLESYRIYIGLIEAFAASLYPDPVERLNFLTQEYNREIEIAELRLRGYDHLADRKAQARDTLTR